MNEKIIFNSSIDLSNKRMNVKIRLVQSRTTVIDILGYIDDIVEEKISETLLLYEQKKETTWQSSLLPFFPKEKEGEVAQVYLCDEVNQIAGTSNYKTIQLVQVSYFDTTNPEEGLTNNMDFFYFDGYDRKTVEKRVEQLVDYWKLGKI